MSKILIGMPNYSGYVPIETYESHVSLRKPLSCGFRAVVQQQVDRARNIIAMDALKGGFDYLLFLDDDNPVPPDALERFLEADKDIVSAPILGRHPEEGRHKMCSYYAKEIEVGGKPLKLYFKIDVFRDEGPLHKVDGTGTGCVLIKRKVLEALNKKYQDRMFEFSEVVFDNKVTIDGREYEKRTMSEDMTFCERAVEEGFEIWLDERVRPFHIIGRNLIQYGVKNG
jgi:glycosyltransferase involved in cell wall biosynthesis